MVWMVVWALLYITWAMLFYCVTYMYVYNISIRIINIILTIIYSSWRYPFLNLWAPFAMVWYVLVFGLHFVYYMLCFGLYKLKVKLVQKYYQKNQHQVFDNFGADNCKDLNQDSGTIEYL